MKTYLLLALSFFLTINSSIGQEYYLEGQSPEGITRITTGTGKQYFGEIVSEDEKSVKLKTKDYGVIIFNKSNIVSKETVTEDEISEEQEGTQSIKEYFFTPSAYSLKQGQSGFSNNYFAYWNFEKGITDNFSIDVGFTIPLLMPLRIGAKAGIDIVEKVRLGCKLNAFSFIDYGSNGGNGTVRSFIPMTIMLQANPMLTLGGTKSNVTIGGSVSYFFSRSTVTYGGFMGANLRLSDKFSVMAEGIVVMLDNSVSSTSLNNIFSGSIGAKYFRSERKTLSFGLTSAIFPISSSRQDVYYVLPLPYIGYRVTFR
jgi:hypothetical protein